MFDEEERPRAARQSLEQPDLGSWSVAELETYIAALEAEIGRARAAIAAKQSHRAGAEALFRKGG